MFDDLNEAISFLLGSDLFTEDEKRLYYYILNDAFYDSPEYRRELITRFENVVVSKSSKK